MTEKTFSAVEIIVVANGYKLREYIKPYGPEYIVANTGEFVFESLDTLVAFLKEHLLVPIENR